MPKRIVPPLRTDPSEKYRPRDTREIVSALKAESAILDAELRNELVGPTADTPFGDKPKRKPK